MDLMLRNDFFETDEVRRFSRLRDRSYYLLAYITFLSLASTTQYHDPCTCTLSTNNLAERIDEDALYVTDAITVLKGLGLVYAENKGSVDLIYPEEAVRLG